MKKYSLITSLLLLILFTACKEGNKKETTIAVSKQEVLVDTTKTYAEISVKQGGEWVNRVYQGDSTFHNVSELVVPQEHTDHSFYIRYEGPGWESNKVGYRLYLDWRNAIDVFGKVTDSLILDRVGQDNFDSYHEMNPWGMDILKVGKGLGVGSVGRYINKEVLHFNNVDTTSVTVNNDANASGITINYTGWETAGDKIDLTSTLSIQKDSRITSHTIQSSMAIDNICTGIVKHGVEYFSNQTEKNDWGYIATYGEQTLVPDNLGMAIFYQKSTIANITEWEHDHLLLFKPSTAPITYYFLGAWEKELNGITTKEAFITYLDTTLEELNAKGTL
ncbi:MAG: DUF4861 domain-containing protein [Flavobacteriaceae bacterium]|nr:MAG: DUF4861 domain-containing protein [Flavobacteriaceae bacterium]